MIGTFRTGRITFLKLEPKAKYLAVERQTNKILGLVTACFDDDTAACLRTRGSECGGWHAVWVDSSGSLVTGSSYADAIAAGHAMLPENA
jgi:hypothetical protein